MTPVTRRLSSALTPLPRSRYLLSGAKSAVLGGRSASSSGMSASPGSRRAAWSCCANYIYNIVLVFRKRGFAVLSIFWLYYYNILVLHPFLCDLWGSRVGKLSVARS